MTDEDLAGQDEDPDRATLLSDEAVRLLSDTGQGRLAVDGPGIARRIRRSRPGPHAAGGAPGSRKALPGPGPAGQATAAPAGRRQLHRIRRPVRPPPAAPAGLTTETDRSAGRPPDRTPASRRSRIRRTSRPIRHPGRPGRILRTEMDRCDRYHTMVGLVAFRMAGTATGLGHRQRPGGRNFPPPAQLRPHRLPGGRHHLVIVPGGHPVPARLQRRVTDRPAATLTGDDDLQVHEPSSPGLSRRRRQPRRQLINSGAAAPCPVDARRRSCIPLPAR